MVRRIHTDLILCFSQGSNLAMLLKKDHSFPRDHRLTFLLQPVPRSHGNRSGPDLRAHSYHTIMTFSYQEERADLSPRRRRLLLPGPAHPHT